jgi:hypothetical protein
MDSWDDPARCFVDFGLVCRFESRLLELSSAFVSLTGKWEMDGNAVNLRDGLEITM